MFRHVVTSGTYTGNAFNLLAKPRDIWWVWLWLLPNSSWQIKQSGDGGSLYSSSSNVFTNISFNQDDGGGNQTNTNSPAIAGSLCNYNAYYVFSDPLGYGQWCVQIAYLHDTAMLCNPRIRYSRGGFSNGTATVAPSPITAGDEIVLFGAGTNSAPDASSTYSIFTGYTNMGIDNTATRPRSWLETHQVGGPYGGQWLFFTDPVKFLVQEDLNPIVTGVISPLPSETNIGLTSMDFNPLAKGNGTSTIATTFGSGLPVRVAGSTWSTAAGGFLQRNLGDASQSLGDNSVSLTEDPIPVEWDRSIYMAQSNGGGQKGQSDFFQWDTSQATRDQLKTCAQGSDTFVLMGQLWVPYNDGASPGVNGSPFNL